ncbi:MAG TPA: hypothetical protein VJS15_10370 [Allosphingosinicella sp.]|nr:hypothetical protein [Allosphingosinicella sp.]
MIARLLVALLLALVPATAMAAVRGAPAPAGPPAIAAQIAVTAGFAALDGRSRCEGDGAKMLFLSVHNQGAAPLTVRSVELLAPSDLMLCRPEGAAGTRVEGGSRRVIPLRVAADAVPRQGATPLILQVTLAADMAGRERVDTLLASQNVEIRIPGLSDALKLLGVPTLLLLPGVLTLTALFLIFTPAGTNKLAPPGPGFWMVAIPISLALSQAYAWIMSAAGFPRDLSERFGLWDIGLIWVVSMILGGLAGWALRAAKARRDEAGAAAVKARTLTASDEPLVLFERLRRLPQDFERPPEWYTLDTRGGFLVNPGGGQPRWLVPQAIPRTAKPANVEKARWDAALAALDALTKAEAKLKDLVDFLRRQHDSGLDLVAWPGEERPRELDATDKPVDPKSKYYVARL